MNMNLSRISKRKVCFSNILFSMKENHLSIRYCSSYIQKSEDVQIVHIYIWYTYQYFQIMLRFCGLEPLILVRMDTGPGINPRIQWRLVTKDCLWPNWTNCWLKMISFFCKLLLSIAILLCPSLVWQVQAAILACPNSKVKLDLRYNYVKLQVVSR